jgi:hypothetical protein
MRNIVDIEKTIEFILSHQANAEVQMEKIRESIAALAAQAESQAAALSAQAGSQAAALAAQAESQAAQAEVQAKGHAHHDFMMAKIDARLDRAIRLSVQDARAQRKRNQEFDEKITQLAAAQLVTEEKMQVTEKMMQVTEKMMQATEQKLQRFLDSLQRGTNGHT